MTIKDNILNAADALELTTLPQGRGHIYSDTYGTYCAIGAICKDALGKQPWTEAKTPYWEVGAHIGHDLVNDIEVWNDFDNLTFSEIADKLRERAAEMDD